MNKQLLLWCSALALCTVSPTLANPADMDTTFNSTGTQTVFFTEGNGDLQALGIHTNGKIAVAGIVLSTPNKMAVAQLLSNGTLDTSFNGTGTQTIEFFPGEDCRCDDIALQSNGNIVLAGYTFLSGITYLAIARLTPTGTLDTTFNTTGTQTISFPGYTYSAATGCALQTDGKIIAVGTVDGTDICVARLNANGSLDTSFNTTGKTVIPAGVGYELGDVVIQTDGKIVIADRGVGVFIARLNTDGTLDTSFGVTGTQTISSFIPGSRSLALQQDGKILIAGREGTAIKIARLNTNGILDTSFSGTGTATFPIGISDRANGITVQPSGKILVTGRTMSVENNEYVVARILADGSGLDTTFNGTGYKIIDFPVQASGVDIALQADGKIVSAGNSTDSTLFSIARQMGDPLPSCCQMIRDLRWRFLH